MVEVACRRCGQRKAGLPQAPLPGKWGPLILADTCAECWRDTQQLAGTFWRGLRVRGQ